MSSSSQMLRDSSGLSLFGVRGFPQATPERFPVILTATFLQIPHWRHCESGRIS